MKLGIVGLPNVGKSTLFNSLTKAGAESANYPFCTIDPNVGIVAVPDERLKLLGDFYQSKKVTPATIEFVDIAGLVKGASKGEGLGNQFLANIREVDAIVHVVRCFEDSNVVHVAGFSRRNLLCRGREASNTDADRSRIYRTISLQFSPRPLPGQVLEYPQSAGICRDKIGQLS